MWVISHKDNTDMSSFNESFESLTAGQILNDNNSLSVRVKDFARYALKKINYFDKRKIYRLDASLIDKILSKRNFFDIGALSVDNVPNLQVSWTQYLEALANAHEPIMKTQSLFLVPFEKFVSDISTVKGLNNLSFSGYQYIKQLEEAVTLIDSITVNLSSCFDLDPSKRQLDKQTVQISSVLENGKNYINLVHSLNRLHLDFYNFEVGYLNKKVNKMSNDLNHVAELIKLSPDFSKETILFISNQIHKFAKYLEFIATYSHLQEQFTNVVNESINTVAKKVRV